MVAPTRMALAVRTDKALATYVSDAVKGSPLAKEDRVPSLDASNAPSTDAGLSMTAGSMLKSIELPEVLLLPEPAASRNGKGPLSQRLGRILAHPALDEFLTSNPAAESDLVTEAKRLGANSLSGEPHHRSPERELDRSLGTR